MEVHYAKMRKNPANRKNFNNLRRLAAEKWQKAANKNSVDINQQQQIMAIFEELINDHNVTVDFPQKLSSALEGII